MQRPPQSPVKKAFSKFGKTKNLFSGIDFKPKTPMNKKNKNQSDNDSGLLSQEFDDPTYSTDNGFNSPQRTSNSNGSPESRRSRRFSARSGHTSIMALMSSPAKRTRKPSGGAVKRTSSQAVVPLGYAESPDFGSIHDNQHDENGDDDESVVSVDPFSNPERQSSKKSLQSKHVAQRPSLLGSDCGVSTESLDVFDLSESPTVERKMMKQKQASQSNRKKKKDNSSDFFATQGHPKGRRKSSINHGGNYNNHDYDDRGNDERMKRARELEEIGNIGSSADMNYNVDDDDDDDDDDSDANTSFDGKKSLASIFNGDHNFECFEDAEADSYYSEEDDEEETSYYDDDDDDDDDYEEEYDDNRYTSQPPQQHYNHNKAASSAPSFKLVSSVPSGGTPPFKQHQQQKQPKKQQKQKPPPQPLQQKLQQYQQPPPQQQQQQQQHRRRSSQPHPQHPLPPTRLQARPNAPNHFAAFVDHGDWRVMGKDANKIRHAPPMHRQQRVMDGDSSSDDSDSSDSSNGSGRRRRRNNNNSSGSGDWEPEHSSSHDGALDNFSDEDTVMEQPKSPKKDKDDEEDKKRGLRSRMSTVEQRRWDDFRTRVQMLIMEVMPDNVDQIDDLLLQFTGREEELIQTLEKRRGRACRSRTNKAVVHRSRQIKAKRHTQEYQTTEALAHIAAACTIDEGVNIKPEFWKDDATSVYTQDIDDTEDMESYYSEEDETSSYYSGSSKGEEEVSGSEGSSFYTDSSSEEEESASEEDYSEEQTEDNSFSYEDNDNWGFAEE